MYYWLSFIQRRKFKKKLKKVHKGDQTQVDILPHFNFLLGRLWSFSVFTTVYHILEFERLIIPIN